LLATRHKKFLYAFQYLGQTDREQVRESVAVTGTYPGVEEDFPAVPLPREQLSQDLSDSSPEEIPDW
jgi:hypothetical protein